ncbi:cyclin-H isoform X3 [Octopus sinensis]|uniref:Cyclin-H n=1 Tax=Octopus sinensis TaxID=2607531 RepID=A0A7E6FD49_9MOLL|nr:cyclin-H isoform X3 [Octopus sinensis]
MFAISTQKSHWTFDSDSALTRLRRKAHDDYVESHRGSISDEDLEAVLFTYEEEYILARHYEFIMKEFCNRFQPPMPKYVLGTAMTYFKRFYLYNSVMDFHPRDITLTSVYLASKVEEFNVSINQFVGNLKGDRDKFANVILGFELLLMEKLSYHLTVHNPFRPLEGFLIDMKTNCQTCSDPEILRQQAEEFLEKSMLTDICLLVSPAQVKYNKYYYCICLALGAIILLRRLPCFYVFLDSPFFCNFIADSRVNGFYFFFSIFILFSELYLIDFVY